MSDDEVEGRQPPGSPGETIQAAMEALGWTQSDLAFAFGVSTATVNQVITGKRGVSPSVNMELTARWPLPILSATGRRKAGVP